MAAAGAVPLAAATKPMPLCVFSKHLHFLDVAGAAAATKEMGFDGIDLTVRKGGHILPENVTEDLPRAADAIRKAGIEFPMITTDIVDAQTPHAGRVLAAMKATGIRVYRWGGFRYDPKLTIDDQLKAVRERSNGLEAMNKQYGVQAVYHTHSGIGQFGASIWDICSALDGLDPKALAINYDIGHATVEGGFGGWINSFRLSTKQLGGVAVKDFLWAKNPKGEWRPQWCPLGQGMVDLKLFAKMLKESGFSGPVQVHFEYPLGGADHGDRKITIEAKEVFAAMKRDLNLLRTLI